MHLLTGADHRIRMGWVQAFFHELRLHATSEQQGFEEHKVRPLHDRRRRLQFVPLIKLPLDEVIVFALVALDGSNHAMHFVEENWSDPILGLELGHHILSLALGQFVLLLNVVEELPRLHVFRVRTALLNAADFVAFIVTTWLLCWFRRFLLHQRRFVKVLVYLAIEVDLFDMTRFIAILVKLFRIFQDFELGRTFWRLVLFVVLVYDAIIVSDHQKLFDGRWRRSL